MKKPYHILVTAGDTYEEVDDVRRITHMATGRLGSLIADEFTRQGMCVTYLCGERSLRPSLTPTKTVTITGVCQLQTAMEALLAEQQFAGVVHSMAVSDYTVGGIATQQELAAEITDRISCGQEGKDLGAQIETAIASAVHTTSGKISSELEDLVVFLKKAPKVISIVKKQQPQTILVGFKLLSGVSEAELMDAANLQIKNSGSDFVLANDLSTIEGDRHKGMLLDASGVVDRPATKQEIARSIVRHVINKAEKEHAK